jgi:hypothetical protein
MDKSLTVFPAAFALALHKVMQWLDEPEPAMQDMHNESQHAQVICSVDNTVSKAHTDHSSITQGT